MDGTAKKQPSRRADFFHRPSKQLTLPLTHSFLPYLLNTPYVLGTGWKKVIDSALEEINMEDMKQDEPINLTGVRK